MVPQLCTSPKWYIYIYIIFIMNIDEYDWHVALHPSSTWHHHCSALSRYTLLSVVFGYRRQQATGSLWIEEQGICWLWSHLANQGGIPSQIRQIMPNPLRYPKSIWKLAAKPPHFHSISHPFAGVFFCFHLLEALKIFETAPSRRWTPRASGVSSKPGRNKGARGGQFCSESSRCPNEFLCLIYAWWPQHGEIVGF